VFQTPPAAKINFENTTTHKKKLMEKFETPEIALSYFFH
jgi:hypothetical protein